MRQTEQRDFVESMDRVERDPALKAPGALRERHASETDPKAVLERLKARRAGSSGDSQPTP